MKLKTEGKLAQEQAENEGQIKAVSRQARAEFKSVEELLRADALQAEPPESLAWRLEQTLAAEQEPKQAWWSRLWKKE